MRSHHVATSIVTLLVCCALGCGDGNGNHNDNDGGGRTATPVTTPSAGAVTPTTSAGGTAPTPTPPPQIACPTTLTYTVDAEGTDVDAGFSGNYFDQPLPAGGALTFMLDCPGEFLGSCGECALSGPMQSATAVDNHRCADATETPCTSDAECAGGACVFFFGAPLPISGGGVPVCITNRVLGAVTGTVSPETGSGASDFDVVWTIFNGLALDQPCPTCSGGALGAAGTCQGGTRDGATCAVHALDPALGNTSFDCPPLPDADIGTVQIALDLTTGTRELAATATCTAAPFTGQPCYCEGQGRPNECVDAVCTVEAAGEGTCAAGPASQTCTLEPFRPCTSEADCPATNDTCEARPRKCSGETDAAGMLTAPLRRTGAASRTNPLQVAAFCVAATRSAGVNTAAGLPGPAAIRLPTTTCAAPSCP